MISEVMCLPYAHFISLYLPQPTLTRNLTAWGSYLCRSLTNTENNMDSKNEIHGNEKNCVANYSPAGQMGQMGQRFSETLCVPRVRGTRKIFKIYCPICPICPICSDVMNKINVSNNNIFCNVQVKKSGFLNLILNKLCTFAPSKHKH